MRYLSVCTGLASESLAWDHMGWEPLGFSEIDPFCCAVLAHRWPGVKNFGDIRGHREWAIDNANVLVGGTPCQSFSLAGLRKGLACPRGRLVFEFLSVLDVARPRWVLWENVAGVLSCDKGRAFGSFLGALGKLGYGFAYRVLDARNFGIAQRRRRVFVIGCAGGWAPAAAVLFEPESMQGGAAPRQCPQPEAPPGVGHDHATGGLPVCKTSKTLLSLKGGYRSNDGEFVPSRVAPCLTSLRHGYCPGDYQFVPDVANCLTRRGAKGINSNMTEGQTVFPVAAGVRRLTPLEWERLMGMPDNYTKIPYRGKPADKCADLPRYAAVGNSIVVPVLAWLGRRLQMVNWRVEEAEKNGVAP